MLYNHTDEAKRRIGYASQIQKSRPIFQLSINGTPIRFHKSALEASKVVGVGRTAINNALKKKTGVRKSGGFLWAYADEFSPEQKFKLIKEIQVRLRIVTEQQ